MDEEALKAKLCHGVPVPEDDDGFHNITKVLAPFMRTLKRRKRIKTDVVADEYKELYLTRSPQELILRLEEGFRDPLKATTLLNETGELLKAVTKSKCFNMYMTDYARGEIQMISQYTMGNQRFEQRFPIETGTYLACHVAYTKEFVISSDILGDVRFPQGIPNAGPTVKAAICLPIITNVQDNCIGVIELYKDCSNPAYDLVNLQICSALTAWLGIALEQNATKLNITRELDIHKQIIQLSDLFFSGALTFEKILSDILKILKAAVSAERGAFYVFSESVPPGSEETIFAEAFEEGYPNEDSTTLYKKRTKLKFVQNEPGIPGYVARTAEIVNIRDAYKDSRFDKSNDSPLYRTRSILCFPIQTCHGVIAALKLINRMSYPYFRKEDIDLLLPHLNEVSLVCQFQELYKDHSKLELKLIEENRLLDSETKPPQEEIALLKLIFQAEQSFPPAFFKFEWDAFSFDEDAFRYMIMAILTSEVFEPCFDIQLFIDFLLRVRKAHRPLPYHNFENTLNIAHCVFLIITKNKDVFNQTEVVSLIIASLCHNIDHSGFTNSFICLQNDTLAQLYDEYCGENHRLEVALFLIQASNVLTKFSSQNYEVIIKNLKRLMITTDMGAHMQNRKEILQHINANTFTWTCLEHRFLAQSMILMCASFCYVLKPIDIAKRIANNFHKELQHQGDLERAMEFEPLPMMDRSKAEIIPECQITLTTVVCVPVIQILVALFPNLAILNELVNQTIEKWKEIVGLRGHEMWKMNVALVKDKKDRKGYRVSVSRSSSIRTFASGR